MFSLGVSILYLANAGRIAEFHPLDRTQIDQAIRWAVGNDAYTNLRPILQFEPEKRDSAQEFLLKLIPGDQEALNLPAMDVKP